MNAETFASLMFNSEASTLNILRLVQEDFEGEADEAYLQKALNEALTVKGLISMLNNSEPTIRVKGFLPLYNIKKALKDYLFKYGPRLKAEDPKHYEFLAYVYTHTLNDILPPSYLDLWIKYSEYNDVLTNFLKAQDKPQADKGTLFRVGLSKLLDLTDCSVRFMGLNIGRNALQGIKETNFDIIFLEDVELWMNDARGPEYALNGLRGVTAWGAIHFKNGLLHIFRPVADDATFNALPEQLQQVLIPNLMGTYENDIFSTPFWELKDKLNRT